MTIIIRNLLSQVLSDLLDINVVVQGGVVVMTRLESHLGENLPDGPDEGLGVVPGEAEGGSEEDDVPLSSRDLDPDLFGLQSLHHPSRSDGCWSPLRSVVDNFYGLE